MSRLPDHLRLPLTRRLQTHLSTIAGRATVLGQRAWAGLDTYDEDDIDAFAQAASPAASALKTAAVAAAVGYYATLLGSRPQRVIPTAIDAVPAFRDPFISVWQALKNGHPYPEAVAAGRARVDAVMVNLANTTARRTGDYVATKAGATTVGWERITNRGACEWCQLVAGQTYHSASSADFGHDRCGCTAVPVFD